MTRRDKAASAPSDSTDQHGMTARIVNCPQCGGESVYAPSNPYRPFCSQRCKNVDFGAWADESFRVAQDADPDNTDHENPGRLQ